MTNSMEEAAARSGAAREEAGPQRQYITFTIGDREFAVDILAVREIRGWTATTKIPNAPRAILGVINLRGTIIPVLDLRASFGEDLTAVTPAHVVIIVVVGTRTAGILVDAVSDILTVNQADIQSVPEVERQGQDAMVRDIILVEKRLVGVLSLDRLLAQSQLELVEKVA